MGYIVACVFCRSIISPDSCHSTALVNLFLRLTVVQELGLIRKPASFMTSICDERGQELLYAGMPITEVFKTEMGLGGTLGLLWFQRRSEFCATIN